MMPYYQYELYLEEINAIQKQQEQENERQEKQQSQIMNNMNPNSMMGNISRNMPKMNIPKF